jgi:hypothetical protein
MAARHVIYAKNSSEAVDKAFKRLAQSYSHKVNEQIDYRKIDRRIRPLVRAMNSVSGIKTYVSCEGHSQMLHTPAYVDFRADHCRQKEDIFYDLLACNEDGFFVELAGCYDLRHGKPSLLLTLEISTTGAGCSYAAGPGGHDSNPKMMKVAPGFAVSPDAFISVKTPGAPKQKVLTDPRFIRKRLDEGISYCTDIFRKYDKK